VSIQNNSAICEASYYGHLEIVKFLVENGADICARNNDPVCWAATNSHFEIVKFLFENGVNTSAQNYLSIRIASLNNNLKLIKFLLVQHENDDNLIYLLNEIYHLNLNYNKNLINKINILIWSIKLDKYSYFKDHFNEEDEIYHFIFNYKCGWSFDNFTKNKYQLKNKYLNLETICSI